MLGVLLKVGFPILFWAGVGYLVGMSASSLLLLVLASSCILIVAAVATTNSTIESEPSSGIARIDDGTIARPSPTTVGARKTEERSPIAA